MHLPVNAQERSVGVDDRGGVAVHAFRLTFENRDDENDTELLRDALHRLRRRARNRFRDVEALVALRLREVRGVEQFLQADDLRPAARGFTNPWDRRFDGDLDVVGRGVLNDPDRERSVGDGHARKQTHQRPASSVPSATDAS